VKATIIFAATILLIIGASMVRRPGAAAAIAVSGRVRPLRSPHPRGRDRLERRIAVLATWR
jgi:hypothetical protein